MEDAALPIKSIDKKIFLFLLVLCLGSLIWTAFEFFIFGKARSQLRADMENQTRMKTLLGAKKINASLMKIEEAVLSLAKEIEGKSSDEDHLRKRLTAIEAQNPLIDQISVLYQPVPPGSMTGLYSPTCERLNDRIVFLRNGYSGDYTRTAWYRATMSDGANWLAPHFEAGGTRLVTGFATPFSRGVHGEAGMVRATLSIEGLNDLMGSLELGKTGYGYILSRKGTFIYYPISEAVSSQKTIFESTTSDTREDQKFLDLTRKALRGESGAARFFSKSTGQYLIVSYQPISSAGWTLGAVFSENELSAFGKSFRRQKTRICLGLLAFLSFLTAILSRSFELRRRNLWLAIISFSALCMAASCYILFLTISTPLQREEDNLIMVDRARLQKFIAATGTYTQSLHGRKAVFIPTGILIRTLAFVEANNMKVSGYIWQKYQDGLHDGISRGFLLPEAETMNVSEAYRFRKGRTETIGWNFEASIREPFDFSKYPLDRPDTRIWIMPRDFQKEVVLTPDLEAYKITAPTGTPGLQENLNFRGYSILGTYFNYRYQVSNANYGFVNPARGNGMPELYFNIIARRNILTPFVSYLLSILVIICLLFIVQLKFSQDEEKKTAYGLSGLTVISIVIYFLFPTFISHVSLRQELSPDGITFIENFYFVTYYLLILVSVNSYLFTGYKNFRLIQYEDGLLMKLFYWPCFSFLALLITFIHFY